MSDMVFPDECFTCSWKFCFPAVVGLSALQTLIKSNWLIVAFASLSLLISCVPAHSITERGEIKSPNRARHVFISLLISTTLLILSVGVFLWWGACKLWIITSLWELPVSHCVMCSLIHDNFLYLLWAGLIEPPPPSFTLLLSDASFSLFTFNLPDQYSWSELL